jgi:hypothetical protein
MGQNVTEIVMLDNNSQRGVEHTADGVWDGAPSLNSSSTVIIPAN